MSRGKFITLEGIDGAGKSTHLAWLADLIQSRGETVLTTREPGGTSLGERLRELLLHEPMQPAAETLLMFAARAEHVATVIEPALAKGMWVISDRFTDASYAYQSGGRGVSWDKIAILENWVQGDLQPDLTLLFDVPVNLARQRLAQSGNPPDRFELQQKEFFERVRTAYLARAAAFPGRVKVIDSSKAHSAVQTQIEHLILEQQCPR